MTDTNKKLSLEARGLYPIHVVRFTLLSNLATFYIQKRRGEPGLFSCEYNLSHKIDIKVKVTTRIGHYALLRLKMVKIQKCFLALDRKYLSPLYIEERGIDIYGIRNC